MARAARCLLACIALAVAGCGSGEDSTPAACLTGAAAFQSALRVAPGDVELVDGVQISECLIPGQPAGELSEAGGAMVGAAEGLAAGARRRPAGPMAVRLGYLVGAAERGAAETGGVHADLLRRLGSVAETGAPPLSSTPGYRRGLEAGREGG
ncbi:MAG TPA: hypothetical protein VKA89_04065 [Solirubrobacterales bacterium]|nr:hypothetical protein [Solirubrobacterales bacterium]